MLKKILQLFLSPTPPIAAPPSPPPTPIAAPPSPPPEVLVTIEPTTETEFKATKHFDYSLKPVPSAEYPENLLIDILEDKYLAGSWNPRDGLESLPTREGYKLKELPKKAQVALANQCALLWARTKNG